MRVVTIASNFPDEYYPTIAPWSKRQVDSIKNFSDVQLEVIAPRPFSLPFKFLPYHNFYKLPPKIISDNNYPIHYPRFPFPIPKKYFFTLTADLFSFFVSNYMLKNIQKSDIIHARFPYLDGYGVLKVCKKWNTPLVFDSHGGGDFGQNCKSIFRLEKYKKTINYATKIFCVAQWQIQEGINRGIPREKLECIPLGVDIEKFKPDNKEKIRQEFHIHEQKIVLFVGELCTRKGINYLLRAISKIDKPKIKDTKFIIIGHGKEKTNLLNLSAELKLQELVLFRGKVSEDELLKWFSLADIFVLLSLAEGRPTVINEAMASECAIIATDVSGIPEQVVDGFNGFLVEPKNIKKSAEKISYLLNNENEMTMMGKNSRKRLIDEGWTWEGYAKKVKTVYKSILEQTL